MYKYKIDSIKLILKYTISHNWEIDFPHKISHFGIGTNLQLQAQQIRNLDFAHNWVSSLGQNGKDVFLTVHIF